MAVQERFIESLEIANKALQTADHMTYITFPLVKENRLLLKILSELKVAILNSVNSLLQYEYYHKRIEIYKNARDNFQTFKEISLGCGISPEQIKKLVDILTLAEKHEKSPFEFVKDNKIVIMSNSVHTDTITLEKIKTFLIETKDVIKKINLQIRK